MQSGKKRAEKMRENQRFGKIDKVCLTKFGITAKIIVSNLFGSQFLQRIDSVLITAGRCIAALLTSQFPGASCVSAIFPALFGF